MLDAISRIERYVDQGRGVFDKDELLQVWMIHHIQIIGEAARGLSDPFRATHPDIPWTQIIGMRHILVHDYFGIDLEEVWGTVTKDMPVLKHQLTEALRREQPPPESEPSEAS
jgi:uncharacterized protein with HEPN domain